MSTNHIPAAISGNTLITRTALALRLRQVTPRLTSWTIRKAEQEGLIQPDKTGRFAGHAVHYYDPARIPELIQRLTPPLSLRPGTLVMHTAYGPGRIVKADPVDPDRRVTYFFSNSALQTVPIISLRRLVSATFVAQRIGVDRKVFLKRCAQRGIDPDYADGRLFYDEGRIEAIRQQWFVPSLRGVRLVLDAHGGVARVEYVNSDGQALLRCVHDKSATQTAMFSHLQRLVSIRELARNEGISRYKLTRLLSAAGVLPLYREGKTQYFALDRARSAVRARMDRECSAVSLRELARRSGISRELLGRKVQHGCIRTIGGGSHEVDRSEVERIERLERARRKGWEALREYGICRVQPRGRRGHEVVAWNISRLISTARRCSYSQRVALYEEVAWACDGAGQRRFQDELSYTFAHWRTAADQQAAHLLVDLFTFLPDALTEYRKHVALMALSVPKRYRLDDAQLRMLAGCRTEAARGRFLNKIDEQVAALLADPESFPPLMRDRSLECNAADDEFVPGALTLSVMDERPNVGMIVCVEQQSWNALRRAWEKTVVVRCGHEELRINPHATAGYMTRNVQDTSLHVLLRAMDTMVLQPAMVDLTTRDRESREFLVRRAS